MGRLLQSENRSRLVILPEGVFKSFQSFKPFKSCEPETVNRFAIVYPVLISE
jgi:hypothetical protein